jgi:glutamyl/glutaminyl-tRNA synthetase
MPETGRFAPSTTGPAHPGTLLAALLCWLDARSRAGRVLLRLEDLDPQRCRPEWTQAMVQDLAELGLDWDGVVHQSDQAPAHEAALERLAEQGRLYPCACSRQDLRRAGRPAPDGGFRYPNTCRARTFPAGGWRACREPLRVRLPEGVVTLIDESGLDLSQDPAMAFGDPVVRRRDGAIAYPLASVVDDAASGVTRIVRGRDLATTTASQARLRELLGFAAPTHRHHLLLLEERGPKLAKLHGSVGMPELRAAGHGPAVLCGFLARAAGLREHEAPTAPRELVAGFSWQRVAREDRVVRFVGGRLVLAGDQAPGS